MIEQHKVNKVRTWGYAIGIIVFVAVVIWKFVAR